MVDISKIADWRKRIEFIEQIGDELKKAYDPEKERFLVEIAVEDKMWGVRCAALNGLEWWVDKKYIDKNNWETLCRIVLFKSDENENLTKKLESLGNKKVDMILNRLKAKRNDQGTIGPSTLKCKGGKTTANESTGFLRY